MFKILHVGDVHAGYKQYGYTMRMVDINHALEHIVNTAIKAAVDLVIFPGDIFDTTHPPLDVALFVRDQMAKLRSKNIKVFAIDGNHDMCSNNWLHLCNMSEDAAVETLSTGFKMHNMVLTKGNDFLTIVGFDYMRKSQIMDALTSMAADGKKADVLVMHQGVFEAAPHIQACELTANQIAAAAAACGVKYVALGHFHDCKLFEQHKVMFCYPGSIEKMASNEADGKKVVEVHFDKDKITTLLHEVPGRAFECFAVKEEDDIQKFKTAMNAYKNSPFIYVRYVSTIPDVAPRLEAAIDGRFMFKLIPDVAMDLGDNLSWTKELAVVSLVDIVSSTYPEGTPENELIMQMLGNPGNVTNIVRAYLTSKKLEIQI